MTSFSRELPKKVQQYKEAGKITCWAAALESWMSVTPQSPGSWFLTSQDKIIESYDMFTDASGGLEIQWGFRFMAAGAGIEFGVFKPSTKLSGAFLYSKLRYKGHIYLFYAGGMSMASGQIGHAVVIYGIKNPWSKDCSVSYMDPWFGEYQQDVPLSYFRQANESVAGWFEYSA
jgi:hypothetical protein